ncbi:DUF397 domain-containing protein [Sphaerisporangium corydalis]|uniref:DUF397 domain-containing protein n=1 Tax=Sphaerisporangium corydalis TaxID=1441875 RepID=A0ABV9EFC3_9ACTN|nr:DUF397 domain-containing protein [Sphaerisporangium corydalis]
MTPAFDLSLCTWRKSSYSNGDGGACVEITVLDEPAHAHLGAASETLILVRDSKRPEGPILKSTRDEWRLFTLALGAEQRSSPAARAFS